MTITEVSPTGVSEVEAGRRLAARGEVPRRRSSRSYASILRANTATIPNGILLLFGVLTIAFGSWRDALFLGMLVSNIAIGSFQEIRSKRALDRLAALVAPEAVVVPDGIDRRLPVDQVVVADLVRVAAGDPVVADGTLVAANGLALDEANLTGESESVVRRRGIRCGRARSWWNGPLPSSGGDSTSSSTVWTGFAASRNGRGTTFASSSRAGVQRHGPSPS